MCGLYLWNSGEDPLADLREWENYIVRKVTIGVSKRTCSVELLVATSIPPLLKLYDPKLRKTNLEELWCECVGWNHIAGSW
jgi:hypothetical protein